MWMEHLNTEIGCKGWKNYRSKNAPETRHEKKKNKKKSEGCVQSQDDKIWPEG